MSTGIEELRADSPAIESSTGRSCYVKCFQSQVRRTGDKKKRAGDGIRTRDNHVGNVELYH